MGSSDYDDDDPEDTNVIDDRLRAEFGRAFPSEANSWRALDELTPAFGRARRVHQAKQLLVGVAAAVVLFGGVGFAASQLADRTDQGLTYAGEPEPDPVEDPLDPLEVTGTTIGRVEPPDTTTPSPDGDESADGSTTTAAGVESTQGTPTSAATTTPNTGSTASTAPPSTTSPATTGSSGGMPTTTLIESECGAIAVSVSGTSVSLVESLPDPGYSVDEKSTGPSEIEVSFEGGREHCELKARMSNGVLVTENEPEHD